MWATSAIKKTKQSKQSPIGRIFAHSGHPAQQLLSCIFSASKNFLTHPIEKMSTPALLTRDVDAQFERTHVE
jgi:hypothetical protein